MDQEKLIDKNDETDEQEDVIKSEVQELNAIEIELQEVEIQIEQLEHKISLSEDREPFMQDYYELKNQYKELLLKKKMQKKALKGSSGSQWDQLRPWVLIYATIIGILCLPYVGMIIWSTFAGWFISLFSGLQALQSNSNALFVALLLLIYYSLPLILLFISWVLYVNLVKDGFEKKVFRYIWIGQGVLTLGNGLLLLFQHILPYL